MKILPYDERVNINHLSACFNDVSNSYKFYWFLAILDHLNESESFDIKIDELALRMISLAWYPLDFYKISFGRQDRFKNLAVLISSNMNVDSRPCAKSLYHQINKNPDSHLRDSLKAKINETLKTYVISRFLRPFFYRELRGMRDHYVDKQIKKLANGNLGYTPYSFSDDAIIVNSAWKAYLITNQQIIRSFIKWHLVKFLNKNNPNIIGISEKIDQPKKRNLSNAKKFWKSFFLENSVRCIYSGEMLSKDKISLDHFIPWSYLVHDEPWNIIPTTKSINSAKGDSLPDLGTYFDHFCKLQFAAMDFYRKRSELTRIESYFVFFNTNDLSNLTYTTFYEKMFAEFNNHVRIARSIGFAKEFS